jgi:hypothetical protein
VDLPLPALELAIHFVLFAAAALFVGVAGLGVLERLAGRAGGGEARTPLIQLRHLTIPVALLVVSVIAERLYHALS